MRFDLSDEAKGEWFKFFLVTVKEDGERVFHKPEEDAGRVCLRPASREIIAEAESKTMKKVSEFVLNPKTKEMERVVYYDQTPEQKKQENEMLWDYTIVDWENLLDKEGNQIPCTRDNKIKLMNVLMFARFINRCLEILSGAEDNKEEQERKNS